MIEIPNWPLYSIELSSVRKILTDWLFSFWKAERKSLYVMTVHETLFLELS